MLISSLGQTATAICAAAVLYITGGTLDNARKIGVYPLVALGCVSALALVLGQYPYFYLTVAFIQVRPRSDPLVTANARTLDRLPVGRGPDAGVDLRTRSLCQHHRVPTPTVASLPLPADAQGFLSRLHDCLPLLLGHRKAIAPGHRLCSRPLRLHRRRIRRRGASHCSGLAAPIPRNFTVRPVVGKTRSFSSRTSDPIGGPGATAMRGSAPWRGNLGRGIRARLVQCRPPRSHHLGLQPTVARLAIIARRSTFQ